MNDFDCYYKSLCSGCSQIGVPLEKQQQQKVDSFLNLMNSQFNLLKKIEIPKMQIHSLGPGQLRDRLDFTWEGGRLGLLNQNKDEIVDLEICRQLSPALQEFLTEFRKIKWPIKKGSIRLRVSPQNKKGIWLDFSNQDIQLLFEEKSCLHQALSLAFVEIGQRRKKLTFNGEKFKLKDPEFYPWSSTYVVKKEIPLYSLVGSFTQIGKTSVEKISEVVEDLINKSGANSIVEFGSGIGTLTLPAAGLNRQVKACEFDSSATEALRLTLSETNLQNQVQIVSGDFQNKSHLQNPCNLLLLNPPRSGVGKFLDFAPLPDKIIYMSCFQESLIKDCLTLVEKNFKMIEIHLIDQFPQTHHAEWVVFWQKD